MIAFCGINCLECGAFQATKADDGEKRAEVAKLWSKQFNSDIKPGDINCMGCHADIHAVFNHCKVCEIRKCGQEEEIANCAFCDDYPCEKLDMIFKALPEAKKRLDNLRLTF